MEEITKAVLGTIDALVASLSQEEYRDVLKDIISDLDSRLETVEWEIEDA